MTAAPKWGEHDLTGKPHNVLGGGTVSLCHPDCPAWERWLASPLGEKVRQQA